MIKLSLPYIYNNNEFYKKLIIDSRDEVFFKDIKFYAYGNMPWSYWHGGKSTNINTKDVILNENINSFLNNFSLPFFFDVSNLNLNEKDLSDKKLNTILSTMHNGSSKIICSDIELAFKLKEKYPYYNFIFSDNACLKLPFTSEIINTILEEKFFEGIIVNPNLIDLNFEFNQIKEKNRIWIRIGNSCDNCENFIQCLHQEQYLQYNFSETSQFNSCEKCLSFKQIVKKIKEEIKHYNLLGFTNFILDESIGIKNLNNYNLLLHYALNKKENNTIERMILSND